MSFLHGLCYYFFFQEIFFFFCSPFSEILGVDGQEEIFGPFYGDSLLSKDGYLRSVPGTFFPLSFYSFLSFVFFSFFLYLLEAP